MLPSVLHSGAVEVTEQDAPAHNTVKYGIGEEATALDSRGVVGGHLKRIQRLWTPPEDGDLLPIPGAGDLGCGRRLAGGGQELVIGEGGVKEDDENPQQGGCRTAGIRIFL